MAEPIGGFPTPWRGKSTNEPPEPAAQHPAEPAAQHPRVPVASQPAIAVDSLGRRLGDRDVLRGISVSVATGQTLAVFGANGAGKTTLLRVLATLLRPHAGAVRILGAPLPEESWRARGRIGFLGHEPLLYPDLSPRDNLLFHARLHGVARARVDELLGAVGAASRAQDP
ncbi:MAG: ATP-binding cassette domain-containing protein, partial [Actinobacteria bacterium]|nr:ATP-binding cassette domain-containing protein [Actinomycetota bacterium]